MKKYETRPYYKKNDNLHYYKVWGLDKSIENDNLSELCRPNLRKKARQKVMMTDPKMWRNVGG